VDNVFDRRSHAEKKLTNIPINYIPSKPRNTWQSWQ